MDGVGPNYLSSVKINPGFDGSSTSGLVSLSVK
jgi:hypothetical protein